ncbi:CBS domain-containing protein [Myroides sp. LJL119]
MFEFQPSLIESVAHFSSNSTVKQCREYILDNSLSHLPFVNQNEEFLGSLLAEDFENQESEQLSNDIIYNLEYFCIEEDTVLNIFEIYDLFTYNDTNVLPVVDKNRCLTGILKKESLLNFWSKTIFIEQPGISLIVSQKVEDYSISLISQIIESNNAKIYGIVLLEQNNGQIQILIKKNKQNTKTILDDLRRHGFEILSHHKEDTYLNDLKQRSQYLNKYLDI